MTCPVNMTVLPEVTAFFDPATNTISYVVKDPKSDSCAIVDSVMDIDYAAGRISYQHADEIIAAGLDIPMITKVMRRAGFKPPSGRTGPRVHDLRHSMVVNRILQWYRSGINPQDKLRFLSTYMGHRDINSTLVYITVTQDLLQEASERFRTVGARCLTMEARS